MNTELIQKLLALGWEPEPYGKPDEHDFYIRKEFEVSQANELKDFTDYIPAPGERLYIAYEVFPNLQIAHWCIWQESENPGNAVWDFDDYETIVDLALQDRLFTYPENRKEG